MMEHAAVGLDDGAAVGLDDGAAVGLDDGALDDGALDVGTSVRASGTVSHMEY